MKPNKIRVVWQEYNQHFAKRETALSCHDLNRKLADFFCPGEFYYYIFDFATYTFAYVSESYKTIIGLEPSELTLDQLIGRTHPEDLDYFSRCENVVASFIFQFLKPEEIFDYKINYCFRMQTANGAYKLFLHQTTTLTLDENGRLESVLGVHSDISHITTTNNYRLSLIGLNGAPSYRNINVYEEDAAVFKSANEHLTKREMEVLRLIADGSTAKEIAEILFIAEPTVRKHRENLLRKTNSRNTAHLIANCVRNGLV